MMEFKVGDLVKWSSALTATDLHDHIGVITERLNLKWGSDRITYQVFWIKANNYKICSHENLVKVENGV